MKLFNNKDGNYPRVGNSAASIEANAEIATEVVTIQMPTGIFIPFNAITDESLIKALSTKSDCVRFVRVADSGTKKQNKDAPLTPRGFKFRRTGKSSTGIRSKDKTIGKVRPASSISPSSSIPAAAPVVDDKITGDAFLDEVIYSCCPRLERSTADTRQLLSALIGLYFDNDQAILDSIRKVANDEVAKYIRSVRKIALEKTDGRVADLQGYFERKSREVRPNFGCL